MARTRSASSASASEVTMTYRPAAAREASDQSSARVTAASASTRSRRDRSSATTTTTTTDGADDRGGIVAGGPRVARERDARIIGTPPVLGALVLFIVVLVVVALLCVASPSARAMENGPESTIFARRRTKVGTPPTKVGTLPTKVGTPPRPPPRGGDRCAREDARVLRAGSSWDAREDARLRRERNAGWDIARMACEHGRSRGAIRSRLRLLDGGGGGKR